MGRYSLGWDLCDRIYPVYVVDYETLIHLILRQKGVDCVCIIDILDEFHYYWSYCCSYLVTCVVFA